MVCGDIVTYKFVNRTFKGVVTCIWGGGTSCFVLRSNGETVYLPVEALTETDEHVNMAYILEKLKGENQNGNKDC